MSEETLSDEIDQISKLPRTEQMALGLAGNMASDNLVFKIWKRVKALEATDRKKIEETNKAWLEVLNELGKMKSRWEDNQYDVCEEDVKVVELLRLKAISRIKPLTPTGMAKNE